MASTRKHSWKTKLGIAAAALAALLLVAFAIAALRAEALANEYKETFAAQLAEQLDRPVRIGAIDVSLWRGTLQLDGFVIGASAESPEAAPEALQLEQASLDVGVLRTLMSLGMRPFVESMVVRDLQVNVVRLPDGTLNWQHIADRMAEGREPQPGEGPDERVQNAVIDRAQLIDAEVAFVDLSRPAGQRGDASAPRISDIQVRIDDAGYEQGMSLTLQAAMLSEKRNLELRASTSGMPEDEAGAVPELRELRLELAETELAPLSPFLAALGSDGRAEAGSTLQQGKLSADLTASGGEQGVVRGRIALQQAQFARGEPFDARLELDLQTDFEAGTLNVKQALLRAGEMELLARARISGLSELPQVHDVQVRSQRLSFDRVRALYPAFDRATDPAELRGPFSLSASGSGTAEAQHVELELNLTQTSLLVPERLRKAPGTTLVLRGVIDVKPGEVEIDQLALQAADFRAVARGTLRELEGDAMRFRLRFDTPSPEAGSLLRLLPKVASAIGDARAVPGTLVLTGEAEGTTERYTAEAKVELQGLDLKLENARFGGGGQAMVEMSKEGELWRAQAEADFTQLTAVYPGVIRKPEPTPLRFQAKLTGVPGRPASLKAEVPNFAVALGRSDLRGSASIANSDNPQIAVEARSSYLDLDDFVPGQQDSTDEPEAKRPPGEDPSALAQADGTVELQVKKGRAAGVEYEDLDARLRLRNGRATAETLRVSAFGGRLSGDGSELPLFGREGSVRLRGQLEGMRAQALLAQFADAPELLLGTLAGKLDVTAAGTSLAAIRDTLDGWVSGRVDEAEFAPASAYAALAERLRSLAGARALEQQLEQATRQVLDERGWQLSRLAGAIRFEDGAVVVQEPLTAGTPQGPLRLEGRVSLSDSGKLTGVWELQPEAIQSLIGVELGLKQPIPLELRIDGPLTRPSFAFGDLGRIVKPMAEAYARTQVEELSRKGVEKALEKSGIEDVLPFGKGKDAPARGAKRGEKKGGSQKPSGSAEKDGSEEPSESPADKARRQIEKRLPDIF